LNQPPTLYTNCNLITGVPSLPRSDALLIEGSRIVAIGNDALLSAAANARRVDLAGSTVIPGFDDCHMHVLSFGLMLSQVDLSSATAPNMAAIRAAIESASQSASRDSVWVLGRGYNQNMLPEQRHPTRFDLDPVSAGRPVVLWHTSGHILTANSKALELAGISGDVSDPIGGEIERDDHGKPTGVLRETAMDLLAGAIPSPTRETAVEAILRASAELAQEGITSATDAATGHGATADFELQAYREAVGSGRLATRLVLMPQIQYVVPSESEPRSPLSFDVGDRAEWLRIGATKIFSDGALTTRTAAITTPYLNTSDRGILTWPPETLERLISRAHTAGWQIATHAIGDRAIRLVLNAYRNAMAETPRDDARHRIEHCTLIRHEDVAELRELGVVPVLQPEDIAVLADAYPAAVGRDRAANNSPVSWFEEAGVPVAFSSDRPVTPGDPLVGVRAAIERRTASGLVLGAEHRTGAERAIHYYTQGSAFASFAEKDRGVLAPGFLADFVVLDNDITWIAPEEVTDTRILMTVVGGQTAYEA
jgi:predicted amidohydrolase YtcJ